MAIVVPTDAYAAVADIEALTGRTYSASTKPTLAQVEDWDKAGAEEMNDVLRAQGYTVPITDTKSAKRLAAMNARYAAGMAEAALLSPNTSQFAGTVGHMYLDMWRADLKGLFQRGVAVGATASPAGGKPEGQTDLQSGGDDEDPTFTTDMKF